MLCKYYKSFTKQFTLKFIQVVIKDKGIPCDMTAK